jgi:hypothetical protein
MIELGGEAGYFCTMEEVCRVVEKRRLNHESALDIKLKLGGRGPMASGSRSRPVSSAGLT